MKINFSNFVKLFLAGASLLAVGCTDYGQDIQNLRDDMNDRFDALQTETIDPLRADLTKVQQELAAAQEDIKAQAEKHEQDLKTLQGVDAELQKQIDTNVTAINNLKGELNDAVAELEKAIKNGDDALAAKINETKQELTTLIEGHVADLQKKIDAINTEITGLKNVDADLQEQITKLADDLKTTNANVAANAKAIATNTTDIAANKKAIEDLNAALDSHVAEFVAYKAEVAGLIAAVNAEIETLKKKDAEIEALIAALDTRLAANEALAAQNAKDIAANKAAFDEYVAATAETLRLMQEAHDALVTRVGNLENDLTAHKEAIRKELDEHYAAFAEYQKEVADEFAAVNETLDAHTAAIKANADAIEANKAAIADNAAAIAALDLRLTTLEEAHAELAEKHKKLQDDFDAYVAKTNEVIASIQAEQLEQNNTLKLHAQQIADLDQAVKDLDAKVDAIKAELEQKIADLEKTLQDQIDDIKGDLETLKGRIQSLVFVPDHVDGAATIHWAEVVNDKQETVVVEAQSVLKFQVYPAECAAAIKPADLKFVFSDALADTRTNNKVLDVVAVDVVEGKEGVIAVKVNARDFSDDFYYGDKKYAASLVFTTETANIASCYVNLAPATPKAIEVALVPNKGEYSLPYTPAGQKVHILPEHKYVFTIDGKGSNTIEGMLDAGYEIEVTKHDPVYTCSDPNKIDEFVNTPAPDEKKPYLNFVTVELANAKPENVGLVETITYAYTVCGKTVEAVSTVEVTKVKGSIDLMTKITWNYAEDAKSDAGLELTNSTDPAEIVASNLPDGIDYMRVIKEGSILSKSIKIGNTDAATVTVDFLEGAKPQIESSNYLWGNTYNVEYVYDLPSCTITLNATIETIDRVREKIFVELLDSEKVIGYKTYFTFENSLTDVKDLKEKDPAQKTIFEQIVANKTNVGEMTEADFLKEVLVTKKNGKYVLSNTYNGAEATADTGLVLDANGVKSTVEFSYVDVTTMPNSVKYVYNVTTWYGQVIEIVKTVNLKLPIDGVYDFVDVPQWVYTKKNSDVIDYYYSVVLPEYYYGTSTPIVISSLESFNASRIDMESAFKVKFTGKDLYDDTYENKIFTFYEELAKEPYCVDVKFELSPVQQGAIISEFEGYKLNYKDYNKLINHVFVTGKLFQKVLVGKNGDVELKELTGTRFSKGNDLDDYRVRPYQIENKFDVVTGTFYLDNASPFYIDVRTFIQLTDNRPNAEGKFSWLQYTIAGQTYYNRDQAIRVVDDSRNSDDPVKLSLTDIEVDFTNGDGENGFAKGFKADQVYKPFELRTSIVESSIPEHLRNDKNKINFTESTHELFVNGNAQLNLTEVMPLDILVELVYVHKGQPITYRETTLTINIKPLESPVQPQP